MQFKSQYLDLSEPRVMGILNVTPDSFSDGGRYTHVDAALRQAEKMQAEGAHIVDIGGESTRPGARAVGVAEELERVIPIIEAIRARLDLVISVDTSKAEVMREAVFAGADMINDVMALQQELAVETVQQLGVPVCLMHMQGEPRTMQDAPDYDDVVTEVYAFLEQRIACCTEAGIDADRILVDPGFGFGKTVSHNMQLMQRIAEFTRLGKPLLLGVSRKSSIGAILERPVEQRLAGSLALACLGVQGGACIIRAHDVAETRDVLQILKAVQTAESAKQN